MRTPFLVFAALLAVPAAAHGDATISYSASSGVQVSGSAAPTHVSASTSGSNAFVSRFGPGGETLVAGAGCTGGGEQVTCAIPSGGVPILTFHGGEGDDQFVGNFYGSDLFLRGDNGNDRLTGGIGFDLVEGGAGNDVLFGRLGNDQLRGGAGDDTLNDQVGSDTYRGDDGNDTFVVEAAVEGADVYRGGSGFDVISYAARTTRVTISPSASEAPTGGGDGGTGENDAVFDDVESWTGGSGDDSFSASGNRIRTMRGGPGNDTLTASTTSLDITLDGGTGQDELRGGVSGDTLRARDGEPDVVTCGSGLDFASLDLRDVPLPSNASCDSSNVSDRREGANVTVLTRRATLRAGGRVAIRLRCPRALGRLGCHGTLKGGRRSRATRYAIASGRTATVRIGLSASDRGARLVVVSVERGTWGPKTTTRVVQLRRG